MVCGFHPPIELVSTGSTTVWLPMILGVLTILRLLVSRLCRVLGAVILGLLPSSCCFLILPFLLSAKTYTTILMPFGMSRRWPWPQKAGNIQMHGFILSSGVTNHGVPRLSAGRFIVTWWRSKVTKPKPRGGCCPRRSPFWSFLHGLLTSGATTPLSRRLRSLSI